MRLASAAVLTMGHGVDLLRKVDVNYVCSTGGYQVPLESSEKSLKRLESESPWKLCGIAAGLGMM